MMDKNIIIILVALLNFLMVGCSSSPTSAPTPTFFEDVDCIDYIADLENLTTRWDDAYELAISTPRINLAEPISSLQELKREISALIEPACSKPVDTKTKFLNMANRGIDLFLTFSANEPTEVPQILYIISQDIYIDALIALSSEQMTVPRRVHYFADGSTGFHIEYYDRTQQFVESERIMRDGVPVIRTVVIDDNNLATIHIFNADQDSGEIRCSIFIMGVQMDTQTGRGKEGLTCEAE